MRMVFVQTGVERVPTRRMQTCSLFTVRAHVYARSQPYVHVLPSLFRGTGLVRRVHPWVQSQADASATDNRQQLRNTAKCRFGFPFKPVAETSRARNDRPKLQVDF